MKFFSNAGALLLISAGPCFAQYGISANPAPPESPAPSPGPDGFNIIDLPAPSNSPSPTTTPEFIAVSGCTDSSACNYNAAANVDDQSCSLPDTGKDCNGVCLNGLAEDCLGVCGGSASCCPATCSVDKLTAMSCDDVAMAVGEATTETCYTLESKGCDCGGCSCGIIVDADGYEQMDGYVASSLTCDKTEKIPVSPQPCTAAKTCDASTCKQYCTASDTCNYAAWNTQGGCILYATCKLPRTVSSVTTTYHKVDDNVGTVDTGECYCSWWTCVNDNGMGMCP